MVARVIKLVVIVMMASACFASMGRNFTSGAFDELLGEDRDGPALSEAQSALLERELMRKLGRQLGEGLTDGATTLPPERRAELETTIDALIAVAAYRSGKGLREEVGPEFRNIVRRDIVNTFAEGARGEIAEALEEAAGRASAAAVDRAFDKLHERLEDPTFRYLMAEVLRDTVNEAIEGGTPYRPGIGETLETTLTTNLLDPFQDSVGGVTDRVALHISDSARRTENLLKTIISGLVVVVVVIGVLYVVRDRQARRARETTAQAQEGLRTVGAALDQIDDESLRHIKERLGSYDHLMQASGPTKRAAKARVRSEAYARDDEA
ncbi:MAG: hypothetical protein EA397_00870 [Deltaproteobacteria bacterium]|nr:MAG: hypothetical protein EA397_00870 [Deltaproteobacteria bacterium]